MAILIQTMTINDKPSILALGQSIFRAEDELPLLHKALLLCVPSLSYVATTMKQIIGFTLVCITPTNVYFTFTIPRCFELAFLGISPLYQGRGIGSRLLTKTLQSIFEHSTQFTCWLLVDTVNVGAMKMYEKIGFRRWMAVDTDIPAYVMGLSDRRYKVKHALHVTNTAQYATQQICVP